jgi:hypothetical protein
MGPRLTESLICQRAKNILHDDGGKRGHRSNSIDLSFSIYFLTAADEGLVYCRFRRVLPTAADTILALWTRLGLGQSGLRLLLPREISENLEQPEKGDDSCVGSKFLPFAKDFESSR